MRFLSVLQMGGELIYEFFFILKYEPLAEQYFISLYIFLKKESTKIDDLLNDFIFKSTVLQVSIKSF